MSVVQETNRDRRWREPAAVYRLWDASGELLYIGSAYEPEVRCKEHQKKPWWPEVASRTEEWHSNRSTAYTEELKAIAVERSKYNKMGTPGYTAPVSEKTRQRNALASVRQKLVTQSGCVKNDTHDAAREAGYSSDEARRLGKMAQIEFLEWTGLFAGSVKWRRKMVEMHGY